MNAATRKKPFSSKQKKEQLKLKREKIRARGNDTSRVLQVFVILDLGDKWADSDDESAAANPAGSHSARRRLNEQPVPEGANRNPNR